MQHLKPRGLGTCSSEGTLASMNPCTFCTLGIQLSWSMSAPPNESILATWKSSTMMSSNL